MQRSAPSCRGEERVVRIVECYAGVAGDGFMLGVRPLSSRNHEHGSGSGCGKNPRSWLEHQAQK